MRLPLVPDISSRDGSSSKNGRMYNVLKETKPTGQELAVVRPGLTEFASTTGAGKGLVCWNGTLVAMYGNETLKLSYTSNPASFTYSATPSFGHNGSSIVWNGEIFCSVPYGNSLDAVAVSPDGIVWEEATLPREALWTDIAWSPDLSLFVVINGLGFATSPDGIAWTERAIPSINSSPNSIAWGGGIFCVVGGGGTDNLISADGITWTKYTLPSSASWRQVAHNGTVFCAVATNSNKAATSSDGITWTARTLPSTNFWSFAANGSLFCAVAAPGGGGSTVACTSSNNGVSWAARTLPASQDWKAITSGGGVFLAAGEGAGVAAYSADGITWTSVQIDDQKWYDAAYNGDYFVLVAEQTNDCAISSGYYLETVGTVSGTFFDFAQSPT